LNAFLNKLWNFDFYAKRNFRLGTGFIAAIVIVVAIGYPIIEVLFAVGNAASTFDLTNYIEIIRSGNAFSYTYQNFEQNFPHIWLLVALSCVLFRIFFIIHSYFISKKALGDEAFKKLFLTGATSFLVGSLSGLLILGLFAGIASLTGFGVTYEGNPINYTMQKLSQFINTHVPTILNVHSYWVAFILTIFLKGLPNYFIHWLSHQTRFFWLVTHRSHHVMEYLYPTATAPAYSFDFLLSIPSTFVAIVVSKLIYTEPLVMEMILFSTFTYSFEVFNHSLAHYQMCYHNPFIRNITRLFGDLGVYHLVHHSAKPQDQTINLGGTPFMFWDRLFGTYRKPYAETPPIGLTNQPPISWSPFRIIYSGIAQLVYEWKMNKDLLTRFKIIFGGIYYKPPVTKDFLVQKVNA
jgi:sterol desaturase/sphingolipid hydroxylase (fatty acid hydroxylase superfamily)